MELYKKSRAPLAALLFLCAIRFQPKRRLETLLQLAAKEIGYNKPEPG